MARTVYVDGRFVPLASACVGVEDRGLQFADSVYEVCAVLNERLLDWPQHRARLARNLGELRIAPPMADTALDIVARRLIAVNRAAEALLYIQVTRGAAKRDHAFPATGRATLIMTVRPFDFARRIGQQAKGVAVVTTPDMRWSRCDIKTTGLLANVLAKQGARAAGAFEAWLVEDGVVTEGASTNAWIVVDGAVITHPLTPRILPGVMREVIFEVAHVERIMIVERPFTLDDALVADEAFVSSTTAPVLPVMQIDGQAVGDGRPGPVSKRLAAAIWARIAAQTGYRP